MATQSPSSLATATFIYCGSFCIHFLACVLFCLVSHLQRDFEMHPFPCVYGEFVHFSLLGSIPLYGRDSAPVPSGWQMAVCGISLLWQWRHAVVNTRYSFQRLGEAAGRRADRLLNGYEVRVRQEEEAVEFYSTVG